MAKYSLAPSYMRSHIKDVYHLAWLKDQTAEVNRLAKAAGWSYPRMHNLIKREYEKEQMERLLND